MLLKEFMYIDRKPLDVADDRRYISHNDSSILRNEDTRKTRLTLKMINEIRRASEAHDIERKEDLGLIRKMYALPPPAPTA
jgi:hypothetical protein